MINITLRMNNINYDITSIVDTSNLSKEVEMEISTDGTFNTASFVIPAVEQFELGEAIDFSRGLIRNSLITIARDQVEYQWRIIGDNVVENPNNTYTHNISLIDRRSETTGINLPGLTLTQSKSERGGIVRSIHTIDKTGYIGNHFYTAENKVFVNSDTTGVNITPSTPIVPLQLKVESANTNIINGNIIVDADGTKEYNIALDMTLVNTQIKYLCFTRNAGIRWLYDCGNIDYIIKIKANEEIISTENGSILAGSGNAAEGWFLSGDVGTVYPTTANYKKIVKITPTVPTAITVEIQVSCPPQKARNYAVYNYFINIQPRGSLNPYDPLLIYYGYPSLSITDLNLNIYKYVEGDPSRKYVDDWVDRLLTSVYVDESLPYTLSSASRARLSTIIAPEFTIKDYNLYQALQEIADFLGAAWEINSDDEIDFIFFDDTNIVDFNDSQKQTTTGTSDLADYASAVQLTAENIASNTIKKEINLTVRSTDEGNARITTDNLMIKTEEPINYISSVIFKGITIDLEGTPTTVNWDITQRVVTKEEWDILPSNFDSSSAGRSMLMKNNTLYFKRGEKGLYGLSYVGGAYPTFTGEPTVNRALFEVIAATAYQSLDILTTTQDGGTDASEAGGIITQNALKVDINYYPFTNSNIHIYKDDQSGFQIERHSYFNESSKVNDPELLGKVAQNTVNRLGGTEYTTTGYLETLAGIPRLGTINSAGRRLTKIILQMTDTYIRYTATYIADYAKISKFVGKKSDYRLYEIPNTAVVDSNRIKRNRIIFGSTNQGLNIMKSFINTLNNTKLNSPVLAKLDFTHSTGTSTVYTTVVSNEFGKSASWKIRMSNNYSAGLKKISRTVSGEPVWFQEEVPYTDTLGRIQSFSTRYYSAYSAGDDYPEVANDLNLILIQPEFTYYKDARETFSFEYETSFGTTDIDKYRIYDGITKYNSFINGRTDYSIECAVLNYIPNRNDIKVDLARCGNLVDTVNIDYHNIVINSLDNGIGLVFYDKISLDILLVVKDTITAGEYIIPFGQPNVPIYRTVIFDSNGGTSVLTQTVFDGALITSPATTRVGYTFAGWYTSTDFTTEFDFNTPITSDMTLHAKWITLTTNVWVYTTTTLSNESIYPQIDDYTCPAPAAYINYLPDANNYSVGYIIAVRPMKLADTEIGVEPCPVRRYIVQ